MSSIWRRLVTRPETWCGNAQGPHHANHTHHVGMPSHAVRQVPCQAAGTHRVPCHTSSRQWATSGVGRTSISIQQSSLLPPQFFNRARCRADSCASRTECWRPETPPATAASMSCPQCQQVNMSTSAVLGNLHVRQHPTRTRPQGRTSSECVQPATVPEAAITFSSLRTLLTAVVLTCSCGALMLAAPPPAAASVPLQPDALRAAYRQALHSVPPEAQIGAQISHQPAPATSYAGSEGEREGSLVAGRWTGGAQSGVVRQRADTHPQQADGSSRAPGAEAAADAAISAGSTLPVGASVPGAPAAAAVAGGEAAPPRRLTVAEQAQEAIAALEAARADVDGGRFPEALAHYTYVVDAHGDLALAEYARLGRALLLYQAGRGSDALLALEDLEVSMRGAAEVHAALAALMWAERPALAFRAEQEWEVAREFDGRYADPRWVAAAKHWPPRAVDALRRFLSLE